MNKTSICSVISLEVIDFKNKNEIEQTELRQQLGTLIALAVVDIAQADRQTFPTESGAVIICNGPLEDALEDALMIALTIRDGLLNENAQSAKPRYVQIGINLGTVTLPQTEAVSGEGVDEAKRIMSFAKPNQILVSRVYHEMASKLTPEIAAMFEQYDMHAHHQEIYAVRLLKEAAAVSPTATPEIDIHNSPTTAAGQLPWQYAVASVLIVLVMFAIAQLWFKAPAPTITMDQPATDTAIAPAPNSTSEPAPTANQAENPPTVKAVTTTKAKSTEVKTINKTHATESSATKPHANSASTTADVHEPNTKAANTSSPEKSTWQTLKDSVQKGAPRACTQVEIAMNQCKP